MFLICTDQDTYTIGQFHDIAVYTYAHSYNVLALCISPVLSIIYCFTDTFFKHIINKPKAIQCAVYAMLYKKIHPSKARYWSCQLLQTYLKRHRDSDCKLYIGNHSWDKTFTNFAEFGVIETVSCYHFLSFNHLD